MSANIEQSTSLAYVHRCNYRKLHPLHALVCIVFMMPYCTRLAFTFPGCIKVWLHTEMEIVVVAVAQKEKGADEVNEGWTILC